MPKQKEVCEVIVNGVRFSTWESVVVNIAFTLAARVAHVSIAETEKEIMSGRGAQNWNDLKIKPGDTCDIYLAGHLVMQNGIVFQRQSSSNAYQHGVLISAISKTVDLIHSSIEMKNATYKGYPLQGIANGVLAPYGTKFIVKNPPPGFDKVFKFAHANPGESPHAFLERLARARGLFLHDDEQGNLVADQVTGSGGGGVTLEEGRNIKQISMVVEDTVIHAGSKLASLGQHWGDDQFNGEDSRKPAAVATNPDAKRYAPKIVVADEPGDPEDMKNRANYELNRRLGDILQVQVTVYGWEQPGGDLWNIGDNGKVRVYAPRHLLNHDLYPEGVTFAQDSRNGTTTTLDLVTKERLSMTLGQSGPPSDAGGGALPGETLKPAEPSP